MNLNKKFLGQDIFMGSPVADAISIDNLLGWASTPTRFDAIEWILQNDGHFPTSDKEYLFYIEATSTEDPVFGIKVFYDNGLAKIGYKFRMGATDTILVADWGSWPAGDTGYHIMDRSPLSSYKGIDPSNITAEDRWQNGLIFWFATGNGNAAFTENELYGWTLGAGAGVEQVENFDGCTYAWDPDATPPHYVITGGAQYSVIGPHGLWNTSAVGQVNNAISVALALKGLSYDLDTFLDDIGGPGGGTGGNYGATPDPIPIPGLPSIGIMDTGMATMWTPSTAEVQALADFLWSDDFFDNIIKNCNPIENIIQMGVVPFDTSSLAGVAKNVLVGNVDTEVSMTPLTAQYIQLDFEELSLTEEFTSAMDYEPNTTMLCYLPMVGVFKVAAYEVYGATLRLVYNVDLFSGDFACFLYCIKGPLTSVLYEHTGNLMLQMPITGANYNSYYKSLVKNGLGVITNAASGNWAGAAENLVDAAMSIDSVDVQRTGDYRGAQGALGMEIPFIIVTVPVQHYPGSEYQKTQGFPCYMTRKLKNLTGFTKVASVKDNTVSATDEEKREIERLLKEGVYL